MPAPRWPRRRSVEAFQHSQESLPGPRQVATAIDPKTVGKVRSELIVALGSPKRLHRGVLDRPVHAKSTVLSDRGPWRSSSASAATRCCRSMSASTPCRRRSRMGSDALVGLHRCLQRHGVSSRLPEVEGDKPLPTSGSSRPIAIGFFHIDIAEVQTATRQAGYLFVQRSTGRTSKFACRSASTKPRCRPRRRRLPARRLIAAVPYRIS